MFSVLVNYINNILSGNSTTNNNDNKLFHYYIEDLNLAYKNAAFIINKFPADYEQAPNFISFILNLLSKVDKNVDISSLIDNQQTKITIRERTKATSSDKNYTWIPNSELEKQQSHIDSLTSLLEKNKTEFSDAKSGWTIEKDKLVEQIKAQRLELKTNKAALHSVEQKLVYQTQDVKLLNSKLSNKTEELDKLTLLFQETKQQLFNFDLRHHAAHDKINNENQIKTLDYNNMVSRLAFNEEQLKTCESNKSKLDQQYAHEIEQHKRKIYDLVAQLSVLNISNDNLRGKIKKLTERVMDHTTMQIIVEPADQVVEKLQNANSRLETVSANVETLYHDSLHEMETTKNQEIDHLKDENNHNRTTIGQLKSKLDELNLELYQTRSEAENCHVREEEQTKLLVEYEAKINTLKGEQDHFRDSKYNLIQLLKLILSDTTFARSNLNYIDDDYNQLLSSIIEAINNLVSERNYFQKQVHGYVSNTKKTFVLNHLAQDLVHLRNVDEVKRVLEKHKIIEFTDVMVKIQKYFLHEFDTPFSMENVHVSLETIKLENLNLRDKLSTEKEYSSGYKSVIDQLKNYILKIETESEQLRDVKQSLWWQLEDAKKQVSANTTIQQRAGDLSNENNMLKSLETRLNQELNDLRKHNQTLIKDSEQRTVDILHLSKYADGFVEIGQYLTSLKSSWTSRQDTVAILENLILSFNNCELPKIKTELQNLFETFYKYLMDNEEQIVHKNNTIKEMSAAKETLTTQIANKNIEIESIAKHVRLLNNRKDMAIQSFVRFNSETSSNLYFLELLTDLFLKYTNQSTPESEYTSHINLLLNYLSSFMKYLKTIENNSGNVKEKYLDQIIINKMSSHKSEHVDKFTNNPSSTVRFRSSGASEPSKAHFNHDPHSVVNEKYVSTTYQQPHFKNNVDEKHVHDYEPPKKVYIETVHAPNNNHIMPHDGINSFNHYLDTHVDQQGANKIGTAGFTIINHDIWKKSGAALPSIEFDSADHLYWNEIIPCSRDFVYDKILASNNRLVQVVCVNSDIVFDIVVQNNTLVNSSESLLDIVLLLFGVSSAHTKAHSTNIYKILLNFNAFANMEIFKSVDNQLISLRLENFKFLSVLGKLDAIKDIASTKLYCMNNGNNLHFPLMLETEQKQNKSFNLCFASDLNRINTSFKILYYNIMSKNQNNESLFQKNSIISYSPDKSVAKYIESLVKDYAILRKNYWDTMFVGSRNVEQEHHLDRTASTQTFDLIFRNRTYSLSIGCRRNIIDDILLGVLDLLTIFNPNVCKTRRVKINKRKFIIMCEDSLHSSHSSFILSPGQTNQVNDPLFTIREHDGRPFSYTFKHNDLDITGLPLFCFNSQVVTLQINNLSKNYKVVELSKHGYFSLNSNLKRVCLDNFKMFISRFSIIDANKFNMKYEKYNL
jgi:hypothetical protein